MKLPYVYNMLSLRGFQLVERTGPYPLCIFKKSLIVSDLLDFCFLVIDDDG